MDTSLYNEDLKYHLFVKGHAQANKTMTAPFMRKSLKGKQTHKKNNVRFLGIYILY